MKKIGIYQECDPICWKTVFTQTFANSFAITFYVNPVKKREFSIIKRRNLLYNSEIFMKQTLNDHLILSW